MVAKISPAKKIVYWKSHLKPEKTPKQYPITVVMGSSERLLLSDKSVSLILTDPPYFDSVQYGELSTLFLAWAEAFGITRRAGRFQSQKEAVPKGKSRRKESNYITKLCAIFRECARVLKQDGKLVLTYHSRNLRAWSALAQALNTNGFKIVGLGTAETENSSDHAKRGKNSFISDLVIECRLASRRQSVTIAVRPNSPEQRELFHVGAAMAEVSDGNYVRLREAFLKRVARMRNRKIVVLRRGP